MPRGQAARTALGKRFAGRRFDVHILVSGALILEPVSDRPRAPEQRVAELAPYLGDEDRRWAEANRPSIEAYNAWADQRPTFSHSVLEWPPCRAAELALSTIKSILNPAAPAARQNRHLNLTG
jgi:hypothetical protein